MGAMLKSLHRRGRVSPIVGELDGGHAGERGLPVEVAGDDADLQRQWPRGTGAEGAVGYHH